MLIPGQYNSTKHVAVLVIMDGYSRFINIKLLTSKDSKIINNYMQEYVLWAKRQASQHSENLSYSVQKVIGDKGGEFCNDAIEAWYTSKGIVHVKVGPKGSQLNLCY